MRGISFLSVIILVLVANIASLAQTIHGQIVDAATGMPITGVSVQNVYTVNTLSCDNKGNFNIPASEGQLVEFKKQGYRTQRVRIPKGNLPVFKVNMEKGVDGPMMVSNTGAAPDYKTDSLRYGQLYKHELEFPKLTGLAMIQHPFSAMSKRNQQIWNFQKEYDFYQGQKYIDYTFNKELVTSITGLTGDSLQAYMQMFRPTYEQLRSMSQYTYYTYIKQTGTLYRRRGVRAKFSSERSSQ